MEDKHDTTYKIAGTVLKTVAGNNLGLYTQADKKAQILVQANALMIAVLLSAAGYLSLFHQAAIPAHEMQRCYGRCIFSPRY